MSSFFKPDLGLFNVWCSQRLFGQSWHDVGRSTASPITFSQMTWCQLVWQEVYCCPLPFPLGFQVGLSHASLFTIGLLWGLVLCGNKIYTACECTYNFRPFLAKTIQVRDMTSLTASECFLPSFSAGVNRYLWSEYCEITPSHTLSLFCIRLPS